MSGRLLKDTLGLFLKLVCVGRLLKDTLGLFLKLVCVGSFLSLFSLRYYLYCENVARVFTLEARAVHIRSVVWLAHVAFVRVYLGEGTAQRLTTL